MKRVALLCSLVLLLSACAGGMNVNLWPFGERLSSAQKCSTQGYREGSDIFGECVAFYDRQGARNTRNILIAIGVTALGVLAFEQECDCFLGPDRGQKFEN